MNIMAQIVPFVLILFYLALTLIGLALAVRFVRAQERIARALEDTATTLRHHPPARQDPAGR